MLLFLSHSGAESDGARELARRLREAGLEVWLDLDHLQPGDRWMRVLEDALRGADAFAVYVGADGIQRWVDREVRVALERSVAEPAFRIVPVLAPGSDPAALPSFLAQHQFVDLRRDTSPDELKRLVGAVLARPPEAVSPLAPGTAPFRGLEYFDVEHAHLYFGRDRETAALVEKLRADRFLAVVGASGSGKSSLVRAGLVPALHRGRFDDGRSWGVRWRVAVFRPGDRPFRELAGALPDLDPELPRAERIRVVGQCRAELERGDAGLESCLTALVPRGQRTLLVVDQLEELFTHGSPPGERRRLVDSLLRAADGGGDRPVHVVATLRADFYSRCWEHPDLPARIALNQHAVRPLDRAERREAVEKPLALAGAAFEPGLADRVLDDAGEEPGNLPLVEHALLQLWERRRGGTLTHAAYEEIGGISGALAHHADAVYEGLDEAGRAVAEKVFLRLTTPGEGTEDTRRRAARDEVVALGPDEAVAERVLGRLADARLVVTRREGDSNVVEVAHEALIREWPRLRGWIDAHRDAIRVERRLMDAAAEWGRLGEDPDALLRGAHLAEAEQWAAENGDDLRPREREFLAVSVEARDRAAREAEERRQHELEMARRLSEEAEARAVAERNAAEGAKRSARRTRRLVRVLALVSVAAAGIGAFAVAKSVEAGRRAAEAESRELAAEAVGVVGSDPSEALLLAFRAANRAPTFEAFEILRRALATRTIRALLRGHTSKIVDVAFSPDGRRVVTAGMDSTVRIWDVATGRATGTLRGRASGVYSAAFSPDGGHIVTAGSDSTARIWNVATGETTKILRGHTGGVNAAAFSPDGRHIVTGSVDGLACIWDVATGLATVILRGHAGVIYAAAFSPDGRRVVTASSDGTARVWDVATGEAIKILRGHAREVYSAAFSPNGRRIVTAGSDSTARLWNVATGKTTEVLRGHAGVIYTADFSPGGGRVITASGDGVTYVWDVTTAQATDTLRGHGSVVAAAAFSPDGQRVVTASWDRTARIWEVSTAQAERSMSMYEPLWRLADFSPDGRRVITAASLDPLGYIWDVARGEVTTILRGHAHQLLDAHFSPDGRRVVTASSDGTARVWDVATGEATEILRGHTDRVNAATFSPEGGHIVTASSDSTARIWNVATGETTKTLRGHAGAIYAAAFSPDGRRVVTASWDSTARIWDAATGEVTEILRGHAGMIYVAAFSPDGRHIVTAGSDSTARVWSVTGGQATTILRGHGDEVRSAAFSPDGRRVITANWDEPVRIWDVATAQAIYIIRWDSHEFFTEPFSRDGRRIATAAPGRGILILEAATGKRLAVLRNRFLARDTLPSSGRDLVTFSTNNNIRTYPVPPANLLAEARSRLPITLSPAHRDKVLGRSGRPGFLARLLRT